MPQVYRQNTVNISIQFSAIVSGIPWLELTPEGAGYKVTACLAR